MTIEKDIQPFFKDLLDRDLCREWLIDWLHPEGPGCPRCGAAPSDRATVSWKKGMRVCCHGCKKYYTAFTGSILAGSQMRPHELAVMFFLIGLCSKTTGGLARQYSFLSAKTISEVVGVSVDTVKLWGRKLELLGGDNQ